MITTTKDFATIMPVVTVAKTCQFDVMCGAKLNYLVGRHCLRPRCPLRWSRQNTYKVNIPGWQTYWHATVVLVLPNTFSCCRQDV